MANFITNFINSFNMELKEKDNKYLKEALNGKYIDFSQVEVDNIFNFSTKESTNKITFNDNNNSKITLKTGELGFLDFIFGTNVQSLYENDNLLEFSTDKDNDNNDEFYFKKTQDGHEINIDENSNGEYELKYIYDKDGNLKEKKKQTITDI